MYLFKSLTFEDSNRNIVCSFDLFIKEGEPILIESALLNGSSVVCTHDGYEDIFDRLWSLAVMSEGDAKVKRQIWNLRQCLIDYLYGE